jgi:pimeloyl-ACP methyl ester carboxylesterase
MVNSIRVSIATATVIATLFCGCGSYDNEGKNVVGKESFIVEKDTFKPIVDLPKEAIQAGFDAFAKESNTTAKRAILGIKSYKIHYNTTDDNGKSVKASGLITVPALTKEFLTAYKNNQIPGLDNPEHNDFTLSIVSDQHGTIFSRDKSPTIDIGPTKPNSLSTLFSSAALFMTVQPDYIGLGDSDIPHPFVLEKSLANATVDMIKASIAFANKAGLPINGQVFLSGYSEGGYATLAAAKEIEENQPDINLMAVAPMAGPYDMEKMGLIALSSPVMPFPPYLANVVHSYSEVYSDIDEKEIITDKYQPILSTIFDGDHNRSVAYISLPHVSSEEPNILEAQNPSKLFKSSIMSDYQNDENTPLRKRFKENSPIDWKPTVPMKLIHCTNDEVIPYKMSELAYNSFQKNGSSTVELTPIDGVTADPARYESVHGNCGVASYGVVIPWFVKVRKGEK